MQSFNLMEKSCFSNLPEAVETMFPISFEPEAAASCPAAKFETIRKQLTFVAVCMVLLCCSCRKELLKDDTINNTLSSGTLATAQKTSLSIVEGPSNLINYGAMICPPSLTGWLSFQLGVADQLGVSCLRSSTLVPGAAKPNSLLNTNYKVLLNFNTSIEADEDDENWMSYVNSKSADENAPTPFVTDLVQYKIDLSAIILLSPIHPVVAVIENEESNRFYYSGSSLDYIRQLSAAISVMHSYDIKVANGGITNQGLNYLVYEDFLDQGKEDSAKMFQQLTHVTPNSPVTQERGAFVDTLLQAYAQMNLDFVNFHYKGTSSNTEALKEMIAYLRKRTNKPIINNELGQFDKDPHTLLAEVQQCTTEGLPYIIWYSPDENEGKKATPLQYDDGTLTSSGVAYQQYLAD